MKKTEAPLDTSRNMRQRERAGRHLQVRLRYELATGKFFIKEKSDNILTGIRTLESLFSRKFSTLSTPLGK